MGSLREVGQTFRPSIPEAVSISAKTTFVSPQHFDSYPDYLDWPLAAVGAGGDLKAHRKGELQVCQPDKRKGRGRASTMAASSGGRAERQGSRRFRLRWR